MREFTVRNRIYLDGRLRQPGETVLLSDDHPTDDPNVGLVEPTIPLVLAPMQPVSDTEPVEPEIVAAPAAPEGDAK